jgi:TPR repeat protein
MGYNKISKIQPWVLLLAVMLLNSTCSFNSDPQLSSTVQDGLLVLGNDPVIDTVALEQKEVTVGLNNRNVLKPVEADDVEKTIDTELEPPYKTQNTTNTTHSQITKASDPKSSSFKADLRENLNVLNKNLLSRLKFDVSGKELNTKIQRDKLKILMDNYAVNVDKHANTEQLKNLADYVTGAINNKVRDQEQLADFYLDGLHGQSYEELAVSWYLLSAINKSAYAQYMLSILYQKGIGVEQDLTESVTWYKKASKNQSSGLAKLKIAKRYLLPYSSIHDEKQAALWMEAAASQGVVEGQYLLGDMYLQGRGVTASAVDAINWYGKAAASGSAYGQYSLGVMYYNGQGVSQNLQEANKWLTSAAIQGHNEAQYLLGRMYEQGFGVQKSLVHAYAWWKMIPEGNVVADDFDGKVSALISAMTPSELIKAKELNKNFQAKIGTG